MRLITARSRRQRGLSMVELMVGLTVGMIVVAGAVTMMVAQITEHRRLMLETQLQQDLRAAADMMGRELHRANFWSHANRAVWAPDAPADKVSNPYVQLTPNVAGTSNAVQFAVTSANRAGTEPEDSEFDAVTEGYGFSVDGNGTLMYLLAGQNQPLTDSKILEITSFTVQQSVQPVALAGFCPSGCDPSIPGNTCPSLQVRTFVITVAGRSTSDHAVTRSITVSSRQRNDDITGVCPP